MVTNMGKETETGNDMRKGNVKRDPKILWEKGNTNRNTIKYDICKKITKRLKNSNRMYQIISSAIETLILQKNL